VLWLRASLNEFKRFEARVVVCLALVPLCSEICAKKEINFLNGLVATIAFAFCYHNAMPSDMDMDNLFLVKVLHERLNNSITHICWRMWHSFFFPVL